MTQSEVVAGGHREGATLNVGAVTTEVVGIGSGDPLVFVDAAGGFAGAPVGVAAIFAGACSSGRGLGTGVDSMRGVAGFGDVAFAVLAGVCFAVCDFDVASTLAVFGPGFGLAGFFGGVAAACLTGGAAACRGRSILVIADSVGATDTPSRARRRADS